jgi:hypothetical protein
MTWQSTFVMVMLMMNEIHFAAPLSCILQKPKFSTCRTGSPFTN